MSVASKNPFELLMDDAPVAVTAKTAKKAAEPAKKAEAAKTEQKPQTEKRGGARGGRGARRGGRGGRGREFDRKSGTGKVDSEKKVHQSWGDAKTDIKEGEKLVNGEIKEGEKSEEEKVETPAEEDNSKTLEEYYAEKAQKLASMGIALPETRTANEGADDSKWKGGVALAKEDEEYFAPLNKSKAKSKKDKKEKVALNIEQRFNETGRRGGFEGRGRGNRAPRGARSAKINVNDESAFPSLA
ncbi:hypothetical protein K493DRAFT_410270 [Basidiobolus meristosporus CBS 931.73]|uniref:Hyaluronan/mRNA-binding protein domain-containing protein n=1 Tax=Basidiobolus meristosporus CBS 931.73 TaxID=1314790 RepID=A0A1Y1XVF3_9FUNG|nr:hypothetical protein K493DRAFT_410270 [Basidiobolus meristosporus CBS 931.73]|eukprot:ORX89729.1 hypothetical protein K493DRAFT_410270 [Basidiobolus meristosporus CBS 931.73]